MYDLYRFSGRTGRLGFALTQIGVFTAAYVFTFLIIVLTGAGDESGAHITGASQGAVAALMAFLLLNGAWISLAAAVRRCHDRGLSGWMLLFAMPPVLGQLWLVLSLVTGEGDRAPNRYGSRAPGLPLPAADLSPRAALA
ncbi:MAG TPA: DUF805 domain-containing protein [Caulobacter sp.]|nr:DUF805 domain-containing protein [Caulobacter sp.]